jgi:hypothetical protein
MSRFTETLKGLMALHEPPLNGVALAERSKMSQATVSRLLGGQEPAQEHVALFCAAISPVRERRVELLLAHLRDVVAAAQIAGIDERHVVLGAAAEFEQTTTSLGADLQLLGEECAKHDDVRAIVVDMVRMILRQRAQLADATAAIYPFPAPAREVAVAESAASGVNPAAVALEVLKSKAAQANRLPAEKATPARRK